MEKIREIIETLSPLLISPNLTSITVGISKRFFLFQMMNKLVNLIEEDPHLNFIALIKSYKVLGRILTGTLHELYRDRNKLYFKNFFLDRKLWKLVKEDLESLYPKYKDIDLTMTKRGVIIYDNYKKHAFNVLLMTIHNGTWVPEPIKKKLSLSDKARFIEEDVYSGELYRNLVLDKGGVWIDNKQSRFVIDFNRSLGKAIYADRSEEFLKVVWNEPLTKKESDEITASYREFYFALTTLLDSHQFNIIFDAHSMKDLPGRPNLSFGTKYIPKFYVPVVKGMQRKVMAMGYSPVYLDNPFRGGNILYWLSVKFPNVFIFSMEVNKKLYMNKSRTKMYKTKVKKIAENISNIFDIDVEDGPEK